MRIGELAFLLVSAIVLSATIGGLRVGTPSGQPSESGPPTAPVLRLNGFFLENQGQIGNLGVRFYASSGGLAVGFGDGTVSYVLRNPVLPVGGNPIAWSETAGAPLTVLARATFEGGNAVTPDGRDPLPHPTHFFLGNDPSRWVAGVRSVREIVYPDAWDGIDVVYRAEGGLKSEFRVGPGTDPAAIRVAYEGIDGLSVDSAGRLVVGTAVGDLLEDAPYAYQRGRDVPCRFDLRGPASYGFACEGWDPTEPLVIDPLVYATFLGGASGEAAWSIAVGSDGHAYAVGDTFSPDFPVTPGAIRSSTPGPDRDIFVAKFDPGGSALAYAAILGGSALDAARAVAVSPAGEAYVGGTTQSADFPVTPGAFQTSLKLKGPDAFVARLNADGSALVYSTYLGGTGTEVANSLALRADGRACATGPASPDFPVTPGAFDTVPSVPPFRKAFVACLEPAGDTLAWATFLGGASSITTGYGIALDAAGDPSVSGITVGDFPITPGAFDTTPNGGSDVFVARLSVDGSTLLYGTYLGGSGSEDLDPNDGLGPSIAVDAEGNAYVAGETFSTDFPVTPGAFDTTPGHPLVKAFLVKLDPTGSAMAYGTFLGKGWGASVAVVGDRAVVTGVTRWADFPTTPDGFDTTHNGVEDVFLVEMNGDGTALAYGTFLGGTSVDWPLGLAVDGAGDAYVAGFTDGRFGFPVTPGAYDTTAAEIDAFVAKVRLPKAEVGAEIDFDPDTLNPKSRGRWVTVYIELPVGHDPRAIDPATIRMNGVLAPVLDPKYGFVTDEASYIVDHDGDGVRERMVKFERAAVIALLPPGTNPVRITGQLRDGTAFAGWSDPVRVLGGAP